MRTPFIPGRGPTLKGTEKDMGKQCDKGTEAEYLEKAKASLKQHKNDLLRSPGCTGVGIGFKRVKGEETDRLAIIVFVAKKLAQPPKLHAIPKELDGVRTDVVEEEELGFDLTATDPFARFEELFSGISVTPREASPTWGSMGCFINTPGDVANQVAAGDYLLTCQHVLQYVTPHDMVIIQPSDGMVPPQPYRCGNYVQGYRSPTRDCAIATVAYGRTFSNEVPNYPWQPGRRPILGVATAAPGQDVYKYGATTKFTRGRVALINYNPPNTNYQNAILIRSEGGEHDVWVAKGDSGSVAILQSNDHIIGLNFAGTRNSIMTNPPRDLPAYAAYFRGFAYDIQTQMNSFSATGGVTLA